MPIAIHFLAVCAFAQQYQYYECKSHIFQYIAKICCLTHAISCHRCVSGRGRFPRSPSPLLMRFHFSSFLIVSHSFTAFTGQRAKTDGLVSSLDIIIDYENRNAVNAGDIAIALQTLFQQSMSHKTHTSCDYVM
eukprot:c18648_g1_i1.p1 GENE.c18648_g1_i1~~c18648_g1_i1.p1  ORF type:complete len:134 (+),score=7.96 c18648_g1_i1:195-596(+)